MRTGPKTMKYRSGPDFGPANKKIINIWTGLNIVQNGPIQNLIGFGIRSVFH